MSHRATQQWDQNNSQVVVMCDPSFRYSQHQRRKFTMTTAVYDVDAEKSFGKVKCPQTSVEDVIPLFA